MNKKTDDSDRRRCQVTTPDGEPCSAPPQNNSEFCYFHDPERAPDRLDAQARGGKGNRASSMQIELSEFAPKAPKDLQPLLVALMNGVSNGEISAPRATAFCSLVNTWMKTLVEPGLEQRVHDLEQAARKFQIKAVLYDPDEDENIER
jgi:hypothetical protein